MAGYAHDWIYPLGESGLELGAGYTAMLISRQGLFRRVSVSDCPACRIDRDPEYQVASLPCAPVVAEKGKWGCVVAVWKYGNVERYRAGQAIDLLLAGYQRCP